MKPEASINYKKIVDNVLEKISRGELQKGDKLPTELCLATKFEVSRTCNITYINIEKNIRI